MANKGGLNLPIHINNKEVKASFNEINKDYFKLLASVKKLEEGTEEYIEASKRLAAVERERKEMISRQKAYREELAKSTDTLEDQTSAMQQFGSSFADAFSALKTGDVLAFRTAMTGVTAGIQTATRAALAFLATPIGVAIAALTGIAIAAQQWSKYNEAAAEANRTTQQLTQLSGDALDDARVRATALEKTFGVDLKTNLTVAKNLVQAFGITYEEAFDRIEDGLIRGGIQNDDFLKSLKEYPKLFAQAGFTVEEFQRIVNTGIDLGVYDDKLPDAIKEFSLAIMEETAASREALENAFGREFTDRIFKGIQDGSHTSKDALKLISAEAETIGLNAQQAQLLTADLFKGAGEDAGGALVIFEAVNTALSEQVRALTPLEEQIKKVADANLRLEQAQNDALKSDQYAAFSNEIAVSWTNFKAGFFEGMNAVLEGLVNVDTAFRRFVFQSVQYTKDAFTMGKDADWDKLGAEFDRKQKEIEKQAAALREADKQKETTEPGPNNNSLKDQEAADKKAAELEKERAARRKAALAEEKKRLDAIEALENEYIKRSEDREADTAVKKAELEQQRALEKAKSLGASLALLDQIEAEHQVKIDEEKAAEEEKELERLRAFEERKKELENEIELARATSDEEREAIKAQQALEKEEAAYENELAKLEKDLSFLELTEGEKNAFRELMEANHQEKMLSIKEKAQAQLHEKEKKWMEASIQATEDLEMAKMNAARTGVDVLRSVFGDKSAIYKGMFLLEKGLAAGEILTTTSKSLAAISANTAMANSAAVAAFPLTAGMPWVAINTATGLKQAATVKINTAMQLAAIAGSAISGFAQGGYTDMFGIGKKDGSGHEIAGIVHVNEYVVPEILRKDPEVPPILEYLEAKRKKVGFASGGQGEGSDPIPQNPLTVTGNSKMEELMDKLLARLDTPLSADIYFGMEAEQKRQEQQKQLQAIQDRAKVKKS